MFEQAGYTPGKISCDMHAHGLKLFSDAPETPAKAISRGSSASPTIGVKVPHLDELESRSIYLLREAFYRFKKMALLWSMGKDSTALLWICRKAFFGRLPFPVLHIDTSYKFPEMYDFRRKWSKTWDLDLLVYRNEPALKNGMNFRAGRFECCSALKTQALHAAVHEYGFEALLLGIRRDEHGIRSKERYFSPRGEDQSWDYADQPAEFWDFAPSKTTAQGHCRVHPLLDWREIDVWQYVRRENIPVPKLYLSRNGLRYRSLGCKTCCLPVKSGAASAGSIIKELRSAPVSERSGRAQDKEDAHMMQKLRSLGYM